MGVSREFLCWPQTFHADRQIWGNFLLGLPDKAFSLPSKMVHCATPAHSDLAKLRPSKLNLLQYMVSSPKMAKMMLATLTGMKDISRSRLPPPLCMCMPYAKWWFACVAKGMP